MDQKLQDILKKIFSLSEGEWSPNLTRSDISSWDSLKHMDLVVTLEKEYNTRLDVREIMSMKSFPDITALLQSKGV